MASTLSSGSISDGFDDISIQRNNLLLLSRIVIRGLLESCMKSKSRMLSSDHRQLQDTFIMVEKALKHGLRMPKSILSFRSADDQLWCVVETLGKCGEEVAEAVACIQQLPNIHSSICKVRAFLRLAVMQKKLADYIQMLVETRGILREFYEPWALLHHDTTAIVFAGSLIGLRVIDCNLYLKEDDLNQQGISVDLNSYIKIPTVPVESEDDAVKTQSDENSNESDREANSEKVGSTSDEQLKVILDQKSYLEERNKYLQTRISNLQQQLAIFEGVRRRGGSTSSLTESVEMNVGVELDELTKLKEMETAMGSMEKDIHEKQDTIILLRKQIDDIKSINLDLYQKLRSAEESGRQRDKLISRLESEKAEVQTSAKLLEAQLKDVETKATHNDNFMETLKLELRAKTDFCASLQNEMADLKLQQKQLEDERDTLKQTLEDMRVKMKTLQCVEKEYLLLQSRYDELEALTKDYEKGLEEMGINFGKSKMHLHDLKETTEAIADAQWESDQDAVNCKQCEKPFSVTRRKHHCRNCGGIYCNTCSENTMPLPSSSKPVRVCDGCYELLLKRYSTKAQTSTTS